MAVELLSSTLFSSWLGGVADSWEASKGGKNKGRLLVMTFGMLLSTIATLLHSLGSAWMHLNTEHTGNGFSNISEISVNSTDYPSSQPSVSMPILAYHLFLRALFAMGKAGIMPVLDGLTLAQLEREGRDRQEYGKERVYGAVSWGIAHILFGPAIDFFGYKTLYATIILSFTGCMITFYLYAKASSPNSNEYIGVIEVADSVDLADEKKCSEEVIAAIKQTQKETREYQSITSSEEDDFFGNGADSANDENSKEKLTLSLITSLLLEKAPILNVSYIICLFSLYIGMSVVESLIFLYFEFLGGSNTMCGFTVSVTVLFELPLFHFAPDVLKWLGSPVSMLQWGCLAYIVRVIGYSLIPQSHPYWVLILEPLHGITIAFALTSSVAVVDSWVPKGYEASGQGLLSMIRGLGMFVGFCVAGYIDDRTLYRVLAAIVTVGVSILGIGRYYSTPKPKKELFSYTAIR
eukprot:CAMPEP_0183718002 /NCGR_PEP_ID=MMETSP0737-20130205/11384_1 /TAXON_ID=385413 /ORGANISM="Thalassiosira miniscula, Strain CCMP1093" /LENGTH=463 /DNA_ID=CAMNT_0025947483 /DNA_START=203 /DNA_END=1594 /DNA_ORIENTATION=+